jgi:mono/diheme cytochrome c family protein
MQPKAVVLACLFAVAGPALPARAADAGLEFFEKKIRPVLVAHCYECHSADAKKLGGGLLLDSREGVHKGGDSGAVLEPGQPDDSLLITAIRYTDDSMKMPPKGKLPASTIADLEAWVKMGAPDSRDKPLRRPSNNSWEEILRTRRDWWSLLPVQSGPAPVPRNAAWSEHPVDRFLLAKLEDEGLSPAEPADPRTLARRLSLVLLGLPPTPEQVSEFVRECEAGGGAEHRLSPAAVEKFVDQLLASPHFGERWARHWMDIVRFTETHGNEWNYEVHHAWRYRDYLIRAFNRDVPYDQFVREHIAGDLLPEPRLDPQTQLNESLIGTSFYRFGEVNHDDCIGLRQIGFDLADNQIDTLTKAFQATTVACARCHDHKLDAVSMHDYYGLLGILRSSRLVSHTLDTSSVNANAIERLRALKVELRQELAQAWLQETRELARCMQAAEARHAKRPEADELARGLNEPRLAKWTAVLAAEKLAPEDLLAPWRKLAAATQADPATFVTEWRKAAEQHAKDDRERTEFNQSQFITWGDFRHGAPADWQVGGQGLRGLPGRSGDLVLHSQGDALLKAVLPAGCFTHALSEKLNGTLRSPVLPAGKKNISFQVLGQRSSAVRLVSNNCQLNYKNYRALTSGELQWVTFSPPDDRESLRTYAELMTMFDNPKFPDQLSALGGDKENYKLPWEKAAENPRSYFGLTRVVLHDTPEPPKPEISHLRPLFAEPAPTTLADLTTRYAKLIEAAVQAWAADKSTDEDVRWLQELLQHELLGNQVSLTPRLEQLVKQYRETEAELALPRIAPGIADGGPGFQQTVFARGDCQRPGEAVPRRYLEVLSNSREGFAAPGSGRLELAARIASPENPLTARVMVNRIWQHLFGAGLVRTVDDFGHVGELPTHPELLDFLAARFVADGWSMKRMIKLLVLTRTFQAANQPSALARELDPRNRWLQHYAARRLEAEGIRDSILNASGRLDHSLFGMSVQPFREKEYADRRLFPGPLDGNGRRSLYIKNNLMEGPKFLAAFDFPGGKVSQGRRDVTNVPAQALALLNDAFVLEQADVWAGRLVARTNDTFATRLDALFQTALSRSPTAEERARFEQTIAQLAEFQQIPANDVLNSRPIWKDVAHAVFNLQEFLYIP